MATDLQPATPATLPKHEVFVEKQLKRAGKRIRALDLAAAGLGFAILTLGYALVMVLLDRAVQLTSPARQVAFGAYLLGAGVYLVWAVVWPLLRRVNPYYAAREIERTLPGAKNSLVNWLDLKRQALPDPVQKALGQRAARDLTQANLDEAVKPKRVSWLGGTAGGLALALLILFLLGPGQFFSLLWRAFAPFTETGVPTRTQLMVLQPEGGDATIPMGRAVSFAVEVRGRVPQPGQPDALRLLYRHNQADGFEEKPLDRGESAQHWVATLPAALVQNGFWYKVAGGDAETAEYRVGVRTIPLVEGCEVTYRYRPYLGWPDQTTRNANLEGHRGTEVALLVRTNRGVGEGQLVVEGEKPLVAALSADEPKAMRFQLVLEKDGKYRIWFTSREGEKNSDPMPYTIKVFGDQAPTVELKKPGSDVELPANGTLRLEGVARDDFGVVRLTLHQKVVDGPALKAKPYRAGKTFQFADRSAPQTLEYKDFVELEKLQSEKGEPVGLKPGQVLEYWLEAADGCDYPGPNVGKTPVYRVTIAKPNPEEDQDQRKQERDMARQEQQQHERQQDQRLNQENEKRAEAKPPQKPQPDKPQQQPKPDQEQKPDPQQAQREKELQERIQQAQEKMRQQEQNQQNQPGQAKNENEQPDKGEPKDQSTPGQGQQPNQANQPQQGENKPQGQPDAKQNQGQGKNEGKPDSRQPDKGEGKGQGERNQNTSQTGGNEGQPQPEGGAKNDPQQAPRAEPKDQPNQAQGGQQQGQPKAGGSGQTAASQPKPDQGEPQSGGTPQGEPKGQGKPQGSAAAQGQQPQPQDPQQAARELAKQLLSDNPKEREAAAEKLAEMQRQASKGSQSNDPKQRAEADQQTQDAARAAEEFAKEAANKDQKTRQAAADALKRAMDKVNREEQAAQGKEKQQIDDLTKQMKGGDPMTREAAEKQLKQMARDASTPENRQAAQDALKNQQQNAGNSGGDPKTKQEIDKLAKQMQGGDPKASAEAKQKLQDVADKGTDPQARQMAQEALDKNNQNAGGGDPKTKEQIQKLAKQLQSGDAKEREAARQQLEKMAQNGNDAQARQAAQEALKRNDATAQGGTGDPKTKEEMEKLAQDMQSGDRETRDKAREQLEKMAREGKDEQTRQQAKEALAKGQGDAQGAEQRAEQLKNMMEQLAKQLQNMDAKEREELLKKLQDLAKNAQDSQQRQDAAEMARRAKELAEAFDKLGKESKQTFEELAKQLQSQNDKQRQEAEQKLDEMRKNAPDEAMKQAAEALHKQNQQRAGDGPKRNTGAGDDPATARDRPPDPAANPDSRHGAQAGSLTLQSFAEFKAKLTKEMMNEAQITEQDLKDLEAMLQRQQPVRPEPEKLDRPQGGNTLPAQGVRQIEAATPGASNAQRSGFTQPPPELREGQSEFTKKLSERQGTRPKQ